MAAILIGPAAWVASTAGLLTSPAWGSAGAHAPGSAAPAAVLSPEEAFGRVVRTVWANDPLPSREVIAEARRVLEGAAQKDPASVRWAYGIAHAARLEGSQATGDAGASRRKEAKQRFEKIAEKEQQNADYQFWFGDACFDMIDDVGFLSKPSLASTGKKAFERALALDPNHVAAHYALGVFFNKAPAIVGGSTAKAKGEGETLLKIPERRGEFWGHLLLARIAAEGKDWAEMSRHYTAAETAKGEGSSPDSAFQGHIAALLNMQKDPAAALREIARYRAVAKPDDVSPDFFDGSAHHQLGQCDLAVAAFEKVLARNQDARNTRFEIAECYEKLGNRSEARKHYGEFAQRFPGDQRAAKAKDALKRLS